MVLLFAIILSVSHASEYSVKATELRVRTNPGGKILCSIPRGTVVKSLGNANGNWLSVEIPKITNCPNEGYVSFEHLTPLPTLKIDEEAKDRLLQPKDFRLIETSTYDPKQEKGRGLKQLTTSLGLATFGNVYKATAMDIEKDILEKLNMAEMSRYFPKEKEKRAIAREISTKVEREILAGQLNNKNVNTAIEYAAGRLVEIIIKRALETEGIKSPERRNLWAQKLLTGFHLCMKGVQNYSEGNKCLDDLQADLVKNMGLAISYELSAQETGAQNSSGAAETYSNCLKPKEKNADERVQGCVLQVMRESVGKFGTAELKKVAFAQLPPQTAADLVTASRKRFTGCLNRAVDRSGFLDCADQFATQSGGEIVYQSVLANDQVSALYPDSAAKNTLAENAKQQFLQCIKSETKKDPQGKVDTENCVRFVRLETAKKVTDRLFALNVNQIGGLTGEQRNTIETVTRSHLNQCWDSKATEASNNKCLKSSIEKLVGSVAELKLKKELPQDLVSAEPEITPELLTSVKSCLKERLPEDILNSPDAAKQVEYCAGKLLKESAIRVAKFEMDEVLTENTTDKNSVSELTENLVEKEFSDCLGESPQESLLTNCTIDLKKSAGIEVARILFHQEFDKFIKEQTFPQHLRIGQKEKDAFLSKLLTSHEDCLNKRTKQNIPESADSAVDSCFKVSIKEMASYLADISFRAKLAENNSQESVIHELSGPFRSEFRICLDEKQAENIHAYVKHITTCGDRLTTTYTLKVAEKEFDLALKSALPESPDTRKSIRNAIFPEFEKCLGNSGANPGKRDSCLNNLKRSATLQIGRAAGREEALKRLNVKTPPESLLELEVEFQKCLEGADVPELCARKHAQNVAKSIGKLKLQSSMTAALGDRLSDYKNEISKMETDFVNCIESIPGQKPDQEFLNNLRNCGVKLENRGIEFAQNFIKEGIRTSASDPQKLQLGFSAAEVIPCFESIIPAGPAEDPAFKTMDPEGVLSKLTGAISDYIDLDLKKSESDFDKLVNEIFLDMHSAGPAESREKLFRLLINEGMMDNLLKAIVRSRVRNSLAELPKEDQLPKELQNLLLSKTTIDRAMNSALMARMRPFLAQKLLKPLLLEGKPMNDPTLKLAFQKLESEMAMALLESYDFGHQLTTGMIQQKIDAKTKGTVSRWFLHKIGYNYDWELLRKTPEGKEAEKFIKEMIIEPAMLGAPPEAAEMEKRRKKAAKLVEAALKNQ